MADQVVYQCHACGERVEYHGIQEHADMHNHSHNLISKVFTCGCGREYGSPEQHKEHQERMHRGRRDSYHFSAIPSTVDLAGRTPNDDQPA